MDGLMQVDTEDERYELERLPDTWSMITYVNCPPIGQNKYAIVY